MIETSKMETATAWQQFAWLMLGLCAVGAAIAVFMVLDAHNAGVLR